ncbi:hypothetical protein JTE90_020841 [Oedothorax gibbosus]|uniref:Uncharacterized protein n=1 Tax=Oedothorax gibbosus TaxID=931172 RepID=A0AAV6US45_9ARAC|nr:hypothetical protein JTE90_020841 [Oedothorax gibbosus]
MIQQSVRNFVVYLANNAYNIRVREYTIQIPIRFIPPQLYHDSLLTWDLEEHFFRTQLQNGRCSRNRGTVFSTGCVGEQDLVVP